MNQGLDEWWGQNSAGNAAAALEKAQLLIQHAERALRTERIADAEDLFRRSLNHLREAVLWHPEKNYVRTYLHEVGRRIHDLFGCTIEFKDGKYFISCPVRLSHVEVGFSVGGSAKVLCSICAEDILDCPHIKGHVYDEVIAKHHHDICNICGERLCNHTEGESYNEVRAFGRIVEMDLDHISLVPNPANPLAVVTGYSLIKSDLLEGLPKVERKHFK